MRNFEGHSPTDGAAAVSGGRGWMHTVPDSAEGVNTRMRADSWMDAFNHHGIHGPGFAASKGPVSFSSLSPPNSAPVVKEDNPKAVEKMDKSLISG